MELLDLAKAELLRSNADRKHPFLYFWLGTQGDYPEVRMVVKRDADPDFNITFFTDSRSPKVEQIRKASRITSAFYHPRKKLQVRLKGEATFIESGAYYEKALQRVESGSSSKDYSTLKPPGAPLQGEVPELGEVLHFLVVKILPERLDILQLGTDQHQRASYSKSGTIWEETLLVP